MTCFKSLVDALSGNKGSKKGIRFIYGAENEEFMPYGELFGQALGLLRALQDRGIGPGEEMLFQIEDNKIFILMFWACLMGGIIPVPVTMGNNDEYRMKVMKIWKILKRPHMAAGKKVLDQLMFFAAENNFTEISGDIKSHTVFTDEIIPAAGEGRIFDAGPDDIAFIQFSSGSTGDPKGVVLTHKNLLANVKMITKGSGATCVDSYLCWMPLTHDLGLIGCHLNPLVNDIEQYNMQTSLFIRRPNLWMQKTHEHRVTMLQSPNFGYKYFLDHLDIESAKKWDLSCVRVLYNGAEPVSAELCDKFIEVLSEFGLKKTAMYPVYGLAEASVAVSFPPPGRHYDKVSLDRRFLAAGEAIKPASGDGDNNRVTFADVGFPLDGCNMRISSGNNPGLTDNIIGRIQIKGDNVTSGYYRNEEATKQAITPDGWLDTGDLGFMRAGRLVVTGRAKEIIFMNGQNFYPHDIERTAEQAPGVELGGVAACGIFNRELQKEELVVFVAFKNENEKFAPLALDIRNRINRQMGIETEDVLPVKKLPKTTSGKIQRYKLVQMHERGDFLEVSGKIRELLCAGRENRPMEGPDSPLEAELCGIFGQVIGGGKISVNDNFFDLGATSLRIVQAAEKLDLKYPGKAAVTDLFKYTTVRKLAKFLQGGRNIILPSVALPAGYFQQMRGAPKIVIYNLRVENNVRLKLDGIASGGGPALNDVLLAVYAYLISMISGSSGIAVQAYDENNKCVVSLDLNMREADEFSDLLALTGREMQKKVLSYTPDDFSAISLNKPGNRAVFFFAGKNLSEFDSRLMDVYDFVLEAFEDADNISIALTFDGSRLVKEKMADFINSYSAMLRAIAEGHIGRTHACKV